MKPKTLYGNAILLISAILLMSGTSVQAHNLDSLENVANNTKLSVRQRLLACEKLGYDLVYSDVNKSLTYARMGLTLSEKINNDSLAGSFYRESGMAHQVKSNYDSAQIYYGKALSHALGKKNEELESFLYLAYGLMYSEMSQYEKSAEYYEKALRLCEKLGLQKRYNTIISNIGITYLKMSNYERAEQYFLKAKDIFLKNPYPAGLAHVYLNMGIMYIEQDKTKEAYDVSVECLKIFQSVGDKSGEALALMNLSRLYSKDKKYDQALDAAGKSLRLAEESGFPYVIKNALSELSQLYYDMGNYRLSEDYAIKETAFIDSAASTEFMLLYQKLIPIYIKQGKPENAINALAKYDSLMKAVNSAQVQNAYSELEIKYETEKKELKISVLEKEKILLEKEKRLTVWFGISGGAVLLLILAFLIIRHRLTRQKVARLEKEKQLIATQAVLDGETAERARLARDLHDGLGGMLSAVKINLSDMKNGVSIESEDVMRFDRVVGLLDESIGELRRVAHNMMPDSLTRYGLRVSLSDFCTNIPGAVFNYYGSDERLEPKLEVMIYRTVHELVNNTLKHAGADEIIVQMIREQDRVSVTVQDNGRGFDPAAPTSGTGLNNIRNRVGSYNGRMDVYSEPGKGTEISVEFKL